MLWNTYGDCANYNVLRGHNHAVLDVHWSHDSTHLCSASADHTLGLWDATNGARIAKLKGHQAVVNACGIASTQGHLLCSVSDDTSARIWDVRMKQNTAHFDHPYQMTAVCYDSTDEYLFTGGIDNEIRVWDLRKGAILRTLQGHQDTITHLCLSPNGSFLLSNSMDDTARVWDIRQGVSTCGCLRFYEGAPHGMDKNLIRCAWSSDSQRIATGSGDRTVVVWDVISRKILYKLPGHKGCVNSVDFHPSEPISKYPHVFFFTLFTNISFPFFFLVLSGSSDKQLFLGELDDPTR